MITALALIYLAGFGLAITGRLYRLNAHRRDYDAWACFWLAVMWPLTAGACWALKAAYDVLTRP